VNIPNALSFARLVLAPVLLVIAWLHQPQLFLVVLVAAFFLDLIDGPIARHLHQVSVVGAELDSIADFSIYIVFVIAAWMLWPEIVIRESSYVALVAASVVVPVAFGVVKFGKPTSLHTWLVKAAAVVTAPSAIILFAGFAQWPFRVAAIVCACAAAEECLIIRRLAEPRSDVKSIFHA